MLAKRAQTDALGDAARAIDRAYAYSVGLEPSAVERARALEVSQQRGLANVCWAVLDSTEFLYVR